MNIRIYCFLVPCTLHNVQNHRPFWSLYLRSYSDSHSGLVPFWVQTTVPDYLAKPQKKLLSYQRFPNIFRGNRNITLVWNGLRCECFKTWEKGVKDGMHWYSNVPDLSTNPVIQTREIRTIVRFVLCSFGFLVKVRNWFDIASHGCNEISQQRTFDNASFLSQS